MKNVKTFLILALVGAWAMAAPTHTKDDILKLITGVHTRVFSVDNLLLQPFAKTASEDGVKEWQTLMNAVGDFVTRDGGDENAEKMMAVLADASKSLLEERQLSYNNAVKGALAPSNQAGGLSRLDPAKITFSKVKFSDLVESNNRLQSKNRAVVLVQEQAGKDRTSKWLFSQKKKDSLEVVERLALTLNTTLDKFQRDLKRLRDAQRP